MRRTLVLMAARYVRALHPLAETELATWRGRALRIPDPDLRRQALATLEAERGNAEGAALVGAHAPASRAEVLVRASVAYQVMYDYLDTITEPPVPEHWADCERLHRAVIEALDPRADASDWYALHPSRDDGGYLARLVGACRSACAELPSYRIVARRLQLSARRSGEVQALAHCAPRETEAMRAWGNRLRAEDAFLTWFEHVAGASSTLDVHTLLALAAEPDLTADWAAAAVPHLTAVCALNTMFDSLVDLPTDRRTGDHSFISYYADSRHAADRLALIAERAVRTAARLPRPERHLAILTAMASLYLSRPEAWTRETRPIARATFAKLRRGMGPLIVLQRLRRHVPWA